MPTARIRRVSNIEIAQDAFPPPRRGSVEINHGKIRYFTDVYSVSTAAIRINMKNIKTIREFFSIFFFFSSFHFTTSRTILLLLLFIRSRARRPLLGWVFLPGVQVVCLTSANIDACNVVTKHMTQSYNRICETFKLLSCGRHVCL